MKLRREKQYRYQSFTDDLIKSRQQNHRIAANFQWQLTGTLNQLKGRLTRLTAAVISYFYCKGRHYRIIGRDKLSQSADTGYVLYGNHTQPTGDVLLPMFLAGSRRFNAIVSPANLGIPIVGHLIPFAGGLPVPTGIRQTQKFNLAIQRLLQKNQFLVIYPEAHVWPYYTQIRPLALGAFHFPVANHVVAYVMTTTYQKRRFGCKPQLTTFIDGPYQANQQLSAKAQQLQLRTMVEQQMQRRAHKSTYQYIHYQRGA